MHRTIILALLLVGITCYRPMKFPIPADHSLDEGEAVSYSTLYFDQKVSHYNYKMQGKTFKQKYLIDTSTWDKSSKGPILMYCGNEGPI